LDETPTEGSTKLLNSGSIYKLIYRIDNSISELLHVVNEINNNKANKSDVYTKEETYTKDEIAQLYALKDSLESVKNELSDKINILINFENESNPLKLVLDSKSDKNSVYTKEEINNKLEDKSDKSESYTKEEIDNKFNEKSDSDAVYTKQEINNLIHEIQE